MTTSCSRHSIRAALLWSNFFSALESDELERLQKAGTLHQLERDERLYTEGECASDLWLLVSGQVKLVKQGSRNRDLLVELLLPQAIFGGVYYASNPIYACSAIAVEETIALSFPMICFREILDANGKLQKALLSDICERLCHAQQMRSLILEDAPHRIRRILLYLYDRFGPEIPHTRALLSDMAGTSVETAIRVTTLLSQQEVISTTRAKIIILNVDELRRLVPSACGPHSCADRIAELPSMASDDRSKNQAG